MQNDIKTALSLIKKGEPPGNSDIISELSVGVDFITDFWNEKYLNEYILRGGSKIKFLTGNSGSGKTHFLELFLALAKDAGYVCSSFSAKKVWIHDFKDIYTNILIEADIMACLKSCSDKIISELGFGDMEFPEGVSPVEHLSQAGLIDPVTKREIRVQLNEMFLKNPLVDNNFALACCLLTGGILGHPILEEPNKELLLSWLMGKKEATIPAVRKLGLSPARITRYNARHMLRSLVEIVRISGKTGIVIAIDDLEILVNQNSLEEIRYTKLRRNDAYESIRELIDEIDTLKNIMFIFAFDRKLIDDEAAGIKSYNALWMRIQNEVFGEKLNRFADIIDLDKLARQEYHANILMEMSRRLASVLASADEYANPIDNAKAAELLSKSQFVSLPRQVNMATVKGGEKNE